MGAKQVGWPLKGDWFYMHRERGSELLFAAAKYVARLEHEGHTLEGFCVNADPSGGWSAHVLTQDADEPPEDNPAPDNVCHCPRASRGLSASFLMYIHPDCPEHGEVAA